MQLRGIEHVKIPPAACANGRVERVHLTILDGVRTVLAHSGLGAKFWAERTSYIEYIRNRTPCGLQRLVDSWQSKQSRLDHSQPFGCQVYYRDHRNPSKLAQRRASYGIHGRYTQLSHLGTIKATKSLHHEMLFLQTICRRQMRLPQTLDQLFKFPRMIPFEKAEMPVSPQRQLLQQPVQMMCKLQNHPLKKVRRTIRSILYLLMNAVLTLSHFEHMFS
jgi:hypothetical protein